MNVNRSKAPRLSVIVRSECNALVPPLTFDFEPNSQAFQPGNVLCRYRQCDGMKKTLDPIDLKLIEMLSENARRSLVGLAKGLGLSRSATQERLERLQTSGVICGYTAVVRWPDDTGIEAWLTVTLGEGVKCAQVVPGILKLTGIRLCHAVAGNLDLLVRVTLPKADDVSEVRDAVAVIGGVANVTTHLVLAEHR